MSDGEVLVSDGRESENGQELLDGLPPWMPRDDASGNFKLLDTVGRAFDRLDGDIQDVDNATSIQNAESVEQLREFGRLVDLAPKQGESREKYRTRLFAEFQLNTNEATTPQLLRNVATLLDISVGNVDYKKNNHGEFTLSIPGEALDQMDLTATEFVDIVSRLTASGFKVDALAKGTFTYLAESAYSGPYDSANGGYDETQLNSDAAKGHDGLDANGDPKNNGGTYAGLLE